MSKQILLNIFITCSVIIVVQSKRAADDYCWRDYDGTVPSDALLTSTPNPNQNPIYIGQTLHEGRIIPGKLYANDNKLYFEFFDVEYTSENSVKILCSEHPSKFEWIPTRHVSVFELKNKILIKGGYEANCTTYIGRTIRDEGQAPGKVMCCGGTPSCYGLYTTQKGIGTLHLDFDILSYNPDSPESDVGTGGLATRKEKCKQITINIFN